MMTPPVEKAFQDYLTNRFGEIWVTELPEDVLSDMMNVFFAGAAIGMKFGRSDGTEFFEATKDVANFVAGASRVPK